MTENGHLPKKIDGPITIHETDREEHPVRYLLCRFDQFFLTRFGERHPKFTGRDVAAADRLIKQYGLEKALLFATLFFGLKDKFTREAGYTFKIFIMQIGKIISTDPRTQAVAAKTLNTLQAVADAMRERKEKR